MEKFCSGMVVIKNGQYQIIQLDPYFRTRKYGIWDSGNEKILDTMCEYSKEFPTKMYGVLKTDVLTSEQLEQLKNLPYFNQFVFFIPSVHCDCKLPSSVRVLYSCVEANYLPRTIITSTPYESKLNQIVWRGQTSKHANYENFRANLCKLVKDDSRFDCKLVNGSWQPPFNPDYRMSKEKQMKYKGILAVDGSGFATTLEWVLGSGCVPLVCSVFLMGFQFNLVPWKHYVPIAPDMSDLFQNVEWVLTHDEECKEIIKNAIKFYQEFMNPEYMFKMLKKTMTP
jgi:hypothetical protein